MNIRQRFISGLNRLSEIARQPFNPSSSRENAPLVAGPEDDMSHTLSFPTGTHTKPFEINISLFKLPPSWGDQSWRIIVATRNARHPYDEKCEHGYFGKEIMNPALLTALEATENVITSATGPKLSTAPFKGSNVYYAQARNGTPHVESAMDGATFWITFNESTRGDRLNPVSHADIRSLYQSLIDALTQAQPDIQRHIDQSAVLQPAANPSSETLMLFHANMDSTAMNAMNSAIEQMGHKPNTVFIVNGQQRHFIKGMEP